MKTYDVYEHPHFGRKVVKKGFIWPAFFFSVIWAWAKGMVAVGFALLGVNWAMGFLLLLLPISFDEYLLLSCLFLLVYMLTVGCNASKWRSNHLRNKGFKLVNTVSQRTIEVVDTTSDPGGGNSKPGETS